MFMDTYSTSSVSGITMNCAFIQFSDFKNCRNISEKVQSRDTLVTPDSRRRRYIFDL